MKKLFYLLGLLFVSLSSIAQFQPSLHTVSNKAYGMAQSGPVDARTYFYDAANFKYRPYVSVAEVKSYLNLAQYRAGQFDIVVNTGGTLSNGVITGGTNAIWYFKDGTADGNLVLKFPIQSVNGQTGNVVVKNADSLRSLPIDTTGGIRNGYLIAFDSVARKWYMVQPSTGSTYSEGTGIIIAGGTISARNTQELWNASQLRSRNISTGTPVVGNILKWNGTQWDYSVDLSGLDSGYISGDTLYVLFDNKSDTLKVNNLASKTYVDQAIANIPLNPTITTDGVTAQGDGSPGNPVRGDTLNTLATQYQILLVNRRIDSLNLTPTGLDTVAHDLTLKGKGTLADKLKVDTFVMATQSWVIANFVAPTIPTVSAGTGISVSAGPNYIVSAVGTPTSNPFKALSIESYGGVSDAIVPASGANATGTNNTPALNSMLAASASGQWCIVPSGNWLFSTAPDSISTKRMYLIIIGDTYHNQQNFIVIKNASGAFRQHRFIHTGIAWGRVNLPTHSSAAAVGGRVSPNWGAYTGTFITIMNTDQVKCWFNKATGWAKGVEIIGSGGNGAQENEFYGGWLAENAIDISLRSLDGSSFVDKNKFFISRIGGGLGIKIDGYSGVASNGETWNGAFRSNEFHVLLEFLDSAMIAYGDITEPLFNITVEGGTNTGILSPTEPFRCKLNNNDLGANSSSNYVRSPKWTGQGVYGSQRLGDVATSKGTMGVDGTIQVPIWNGGTYYGNQAIIDGSGFVNVFVRNNLSQTSRTGAQAYFKFMNYETPDVTQIITASYTAAASDKYIFCNGSSIVNTLPTASTYPTREITFVNINSVSTATFAITGIATGFTNYKLPPKSAITWRSDGANWYPKSAALPLPIGLGYLDAITTAGYIIVSDGTTASWDENHAGFLRYMATTTSSSGTTLATLALPTNKGMELEVIIMGYRTADQTLYRTHIIKGYATTGSGSSLKTNTVVSSHTSDFTPAVFTEQASGTLTYTVTVSSAASETVQWVAYIKLRPTFTSL